jgi:hypothetical protein
MPTSVYTTPILGNRIYTEVEIDIKNPTDSIFLKDALNEAVIAVFNAKIADSNNYDSKIKLKVKHIGLSAVDYDKNGYPILYRVTASITAYISDMHNNFYSYNASGSYDFSIDADAVLSNDIKHNAIKEAFLKALQMIEFEIAQKGMRYDNQGD